MKKVPFLLLAGFLPAAALGALVPEPAVAPLDLFGTSVDLRPGLRVGIANDSNFYTESARREDSTDIYTLTPSLTARIGDDTEYSELMLTATGGWVSVDDDDNYTDYRAAYAARYAPAGNVQVSLSLGTSQGHDDRGSGNTDTCTNNPLIVLPLTACGAEPNTFQDVNGNLAFTLGSPDSRGRLTLGVDGMGRRYTNNGLTTPALEYDSTGGMLKFAWEVGGKTDAVLEAKLTDFDYLSGTAADSGDMEYLVGVEWDVSGKTTGYAKVGVQEKDFVDNTKKDLDDTAWRLGVTWLPQEQTMINVELAKRIEESTVPGTSAKDVTNWNLRASHLFSDRVEPYVRVSQENSDYQGAAGVLRRDEGSTVGLGVDYKFRRWAVFGLGWTRTEESTDVGGGLLDFERDVILLTADLTLRGGLPPANHDVHPVCMCAATESRRACFGLHPHHRLCGCEHPCAR